MPLPLKEPSPWLATAVLAVAVLAAWGGALGNGFVWDDEWLVLNNPNLSAQRIPQLVTQGFFPEDGQETGFYRPVVLLTLLADRLLWKQWAPGFHATNLLIHLVNALLVYALAVRMLAGRRGRGWAALGAATVFAVLPVHVEAVAFVSGRTDSLATLFSLGALGLHMAASRRGLPATAVSVACTGLAMLSKESAVVLPVVIVLWDLLRGRADPKRGRASMWPVWAAHSLAVAAVVALRFALLSQPLGKLFGSVSPLERVLTALPAAQFYLSALLWPGLTTNALPQLPPVGSPLDGRFLISLVSVGAFVALCVLLYRVEPGAGRGLSLAAASAAFTTAMLPLPVTAEMPYPLAERFIYLAAAGLALALSFPLQRLLRPLAEGRGAGGVAAAPALLLVLIVAWCIGAQSRASDWKNPVTLFETLSLRSPGSAGPRYNLAVAYSRLGRMDRAAAAYEQALRIDPGDVRIRNNLAVVYQSLGQTAEAERLYRSVLRDDPSAAEIRFNLATLLQETGRLDEAAAEYRETIRRHPFLVEAHVHLGETLRDSGDMVGALASYREAVRLAPGSGEAHARFGAMLAATGSVEQGVELMRRGLALDPGDERVRNDLAVALIRLKEAEEALRLLDESIALWPEDATPHFNRGNALRELGRNREAAEAYGTAVGMSPGYTRALNNLGVTLADLGRGEEALAAFDRLVELEPLSPRAHNNRGVILQSLGRPEQARRAFERAIALDPDFPEPARRLRELGSAAP